MRYEKEQAYIIHLLKCLVKNATPDAPADDLDWHIIDILVAEQRIASTLYFVLSKLPAYILEKIPHWNSYVFAYKQSLVADANKSFEIDNIKECFSKTNIEYILLKGSVTKHLYSDPAVRQMSDVDILYRNNSPLEVQKLFASMGYHLHKKEPDEISFYKPTGEVKVEMQSSLMDRGYVKWYDYFKNIWDYSEKISKNEYLMNKETFYIYHFVHMAKHFRNGGIGIYQLMDVYMMNKAYSSMNRNYIEEQLELLGLKKFYENILILLDVWFEEKKVTGDELITIQLLSEYIFRNGAFGRKSQVGINEAIGSNQKTPSLIRKIFPDYHTVNSYYGGALSRIKWLLPIYWVRLNIRRLFRSPKSSKTVYSSIKNVNELHIEKTRELMKRCDFDMKI